MEIEEEYRREREITQAALAALQEAGEERVIQVGDYIEGMVAAWQTATKEKRDLLRMALEAGYVDMESAQVVAIKRKPAFPSLFNFRKPVRAGSKVLVIGDPDGIRTHDLQLDKLAC